MKDNFDIIQNVTNSVTLVNLVDTLGNFIHASAIAVVYTFGTNYQKSLPIIIISLNTIYASSDETTSDANFLGFFVAVGYINQKLVMKY